jgi:hypothetical protein
MIDMKPKNTIQPNLVKVADNIEGLFIEPIKEQQNSKHKKLSNLVELVEIIISKKEEAHD